MIRIGLLRRVILEGLGLFMAEMRHYLRIPCYAWGKRQGMLTISRGIHVPAAPWHIESVYVFDAGSKLSHVSVGGRRLEFTSP